MIFPLFLNVTIIIHIIIIIIMEIKGIAWQSGYTHLSQFCLGLMWYVGFLYFVREDEQWVKNGCDSSLMDEYIRVR